MAIKISEAKAHAAEIEKYQALLNGAIAKACDAGLDVTIDTYENTRIDRKGSRPFVRVRAFVSPAFLLPE